MRQFVLIAFALVLTGCQTQKYYACRQESTREACRGLPGAPA
jgi:hypothetical protein